MFAIYVMLAGIIAAWLLMRLWFEWLDHRYFCHGCYPTGNKKKISRLEYERNGGKCRQCAERERRWR